MTKFEKITEIAFLLSRYFFVFGKIVSLYYYL